MNKSFITHNLKFLKTALVLLIAMMLLGCSVAPKEEIKDDGGKEDPATQVVLESIYVSKKPNKTIYEPNDLIDLTGLEVKARYSDKSEKVVTDW